MIFPNISRFMFLLLMVFISSFVFSQDKKEAVVLYNTQPVRAMIDVPTKEIDYIINQENDFLKGFRLEVPDYEKFLNQQKDLFSESNSLIDKSKSMDVVKSQKTETEDRLIDVNEPVFSYVRFRKGFATLSDDAIRHLEKVIDESQRSQKRIILRSLSIDEENVLAKNRANAMKTYLKIRGLSADLISIQHLKGEIDVDEIMVVFPEK